MGCGWFSHNFYQTVVLAREIVLTVTPQATRTPTPTATHTPTATATHTPVPTAVVLIGAGDISVPGLGYYSYDLGAWHMVSLNSNCHTVRCDENSIQAQ